MNVKTVMILAVGDPETGNSMRLELGDEFATVFNKVFPTQAPSSGLEHQSNMRHTLADGRSIGVNPAVVALLEEAEEE